MKEVSFSETITEGEDIAPEVVEKLYREGSFYIVKDLPVKTEFGIDMKSWNTGDKFLGLKMIPGGVHYIYYNVVAKDGSVSPRRGFFLHFVPGEVTVHRYDQSTEEIVDDVSEEDKERIKSSLKNIDGNLGAYPQDSWKKWLSLSGRITKERLAQLQVRDDQNSVASRIAFTPITKQKYPYGASATDISKHCLDSSYQLEIFLSNLEKIEDILAQLQLAFVVFLIGQDYDSFDHWKLITNMLCGCMEATLKYPQLFLNFITDLHFQVGAETQTEYFSILISVDFLLYRCWRFPRISLWILFRATISWLFPSRTYLPTFEKVKPAIS